MSSSGVRRIVPLTFGWEHIPKSISVHGASHDVRLREPVPGILLRGRRRVVPARHRVQHAGPARPASCGAGSPTWTSRTSWSATPATPSSGRSSWSGIDPADVVDRGAQPPALRPRRRACAGSPSTPRSTCQQPRARPRARRCGRPSPRRCAASTTTTTASTGASPTATSSSPPASPRSRPTGTRSGTRRFVVDLADGGGLRVRLRRRRPPGEPRRRVRPRLGRHRRRRAGRRVDPPPQGDRRREGLPRRSPATTPTCGRRSPRRWAAPARHRTATATSRASAPSAPASDGLIVRSIGLGDRHAASRSCGGGTARAVG